MSHIVIACHAWYDDLVGGSFRLASEFSEYLATRGHIVSYLCCATDANNAWPVKETIRGVNVVRYRPSVSPQSGIARLRHHLRESGRLTKMLQSEQPIDFLSGHSPLQALGARQALDRRVVHFNYTVHSPFDDELLSNSSSSRLSLGQRAAGFAARHIDRRNCKLAHTVQCDSHYTLSVMQNRHKKAVSNKGMVSPGWVETSRFQPAGSREHVRNTLGHHWSFDGPVFFTLRRLQNRMGLETLIEACRLLHASGRAFRTLIGGSGPLRESLQKQIENAGLANHVFLLGRLPEEQLPLVYAAADCFVLPTKALECFGLIVLEAFACNTPVIASNVAAIPELAEQQGNGWMFEPGNAEQLADRMQAFLEQRLKPSVNLREIALKYDKANVLKEWERVLMGEARG